MIAKIDQLRDLFIDLMGFAPELSLPVFAVVWILSALFRVRDRYPEMKTPILATMNVAASCVGFIIYHNITKNTDKALPADVLFYRTIMLASFTALGYQFLVPTLRFLHSKLSGILEAIVSKILPESKADKDE